MIMFTSKDIEELEEISSQVSMASTRLMQVHVKFKRKQRMELLGLAGELTSIQAAIKRIALLQKED